jgi:hypothetical protein
MPTLGTGRPAISYRADTTSTISESWSAFIAITVSFLMTRPSRASTGTPLTSSLPVAGDQVAEISPVKRARRFRVRQKHCAAHLCVGSNRQRAFRVPATRQQDDPAGPIGLRKRLIPLLRYAT